MISEVWGYVTNKHEKIEKVALQITNGVYPQEDVTPVSYTHLDVYKRQIYSLDSYIIPGYNQFLVYVTCLTFVKFSNYWNN